MKRIETVLPKVIPSEHQAGSINRLYTAQMNLEPFARIGIVPTESSAYKAVNIYFINLISYSLYFYYPRDCALMI